MYAYNILICEDEPLIGLGLQKMLRESGLPIQNIYLTGDGQQALNQLSECEAQIILTDIEMPNLNGLDFLKELLSARPETQCVIITGYSEFTYAQAAIKLGVNSYLLKPVDSKELYKVIRDCMDTLEERARYNKLLPELLTSAMGKAIGSLLPVSALAEIPQNHFTLPVFSCLSFHLNHPSDNSLCEAIAAVRKLVIQYLPKSVLIPTGVHEFRVILNLRSEDSVFDLLLTEIKQLLKYLSQERGILLYCGAGSITVNPLQFFLSIETAENALNARFFPNTAALLCFTQSSIPQSTAHYLEQAEAALLQTIKDCSAQKLSGDINRLFDLILKLPNTCFQQLRPILLQLAEHIVDLGEEVSFLSVPELLESSDSLEKLKTELEQKLLFWCKMRWQQREKNWDCVSHAIAYIEKNYSKDVSLTTLANIVSMNYTYFSGIFKKRTGLSVTHYLKKVRIEHSKELLSDTDMRIYEIAHEVGFPDEHYFVKVFKLFERITPGEYRTKSPDKGGQKYNEEAIV